jgi:site-specific recombinase XerD
MKKLKDNALFRLIRDYLTVYLPDQRCCSPNTIKSYRETLNQLFDFVTAEKKISLTDVTFDTLSSQMISDYLSWLEKVCHCGVSTRNQRLAGIRSFFKYAGRMDLAVTVFQKDLEKVPFKKTGSKTVDFMTEEALKTVLAQPDTSTKTGIRDLFFMILMYDTGARNREILDLRVKDFDADSKTPCVHLTGKGNKKRIVPVMAKTVEHFRNYVSLYHPGGISERYLFYTVRNGILQPMSDDNVSRFMKKYGRAARGTCPEVPDNLHPHLFRHSRSIHLYRSGMPLALLSEWLGHAQLETTMIYAYADTEMKRDAIQKATGDHNPLMDSDQIPIWKGDDQIIRKLYGLK